MQQAAEEFPEKMYLSKRIRMEYHLKASLPASLDWVVRSFFYIPRILTLKRLKTDVEPKSAVDLPAAE